MRESKQFFRLIFDSLPTHVAILDEVGTIIYVNAAWCRFAEANDLNQPDYCLGMNYLIVCEQASGDETPQALLVAQGIREIMTRQRHEYSLEYACHSSLEERWFAVTITLFEDHGAVRIVVSHENITKRKQVEIALLHSIEELEIAYQQSVIYGRELRTEIIARKRVEEALRFSQAQLQTLIEQAPISIAMFDRDMRYLVASQRWVDEYGRGHHDLIGRYHYEIHPDLPDWWKVVHQRGLAGEILGNNDELWVQADGSKNWLRWAVLPWHNAQGEIGGIIISAEDISEHKLAEEQFRLVVEASPQAIVLVGQDSKIRLVNTRAETLFGYARDELVGQTIEILLPEADRPRHQHEVKIFLSAPTTRPMGAGRDLFGLRKDGSKVPLEIGLSVIDTPLETLILASVIDITERKMAEAALRASQEHFRQVVISISDHIYVTEIGSEGLLRNRYISPNVELLSGYDPQNFMANWSFWSSLIHPADRETARAQFERLHQAQNSEAEYRLIRADGQTIWVRDSARMEHEGQVKVIYGVVSNITVRKQAEEALRRYAERLHTLHELDVGIMSAQSPTAMTQTVLKRLRQLIPCQQASVALFDFETQEAVILAAEVDQGTPVQVGLRQPLRSDWAAALRQGQVLAVKDTSVLNQPLPLAEMLMIEGMRSYLNMPLVAGDELMGVVNLASDHSGAFNAEYTEIAQEITSQLAIALQQARLREQVGGARERLEILSHRLLEAQETERRHIARELHDEIGQNLSMIKVDLQTLQQLPQVRTLAAQLDESIGIVERALHQVRALSVELRPSLLDDLGLVPALRWYIDRQSQRGGFTARFVAGTLEARLSPELETVCYRLAQEALTNILRYAQAHQVEVELQPREKELWLTIRDDGVGFDVTTALKQAVRGASLGLLSMQERVSLVGGWFEIQSAPGQGTIIQVRLPLKYAPAVKFD